MSIPEVHINRHPTRSIQDTDFGLILDTSSQAIEIPVKELPSPTSLSSLKSSIGSSTLEYVEEKTQRQKRSVLQKMWICTVTASMTFVASFASSFNVPAFQAQEHQFHQSYAVVDLSSALYVAGQGLGKFYFSHLRYMADL